jgi:steroid 5-alpha reductase family enzyme
MSGLLLLGLAACVCASSMSVIWLIGRRLRNYSFVDLAWSAHFAVIALLYGLLGPGWPARRLLIGGMYALWSLRLAFHLGRRIIGEPEEGRYVSLREEWSKGGSVDLKFLGFFQLQGALNVFLSLPLLAAALNPVPRFSWLEWLAVGIFAIAVTGEAAADETLARFKADPANRGQVCDRGLWRYSRHPNYFFEWTIWVSYAVFALASPPLGYAGLLMPPLMLHFLLNVTGIKATEEQSLKSRGAAYRDYQERTSAFVPWPPRRRTGDAPNPETRQTP